jgi:acyl-coenzyme A thioesterase PaaI-like protein
MRYHVHEKQQNSKMCFVCGLKNVAGLKASFYRLENNEMLGLFTPGDEHQSYPNRLHGGIAAAILDETIGRTILALHEDEVWGVTVDFNLKYRKPVPLNVELRVRGRITKEGGRLFEGSGEILLPDGTVAVEATGRYMKLPIDKIADFDYEEQEWEVVNGPSDPVEIELNP